jgi:hypothetical protein
MGSSWRAELIFARDDYKIIKIDQTKLALVAGDTKSQHIALPQIHNVPTWSTLWRDGSGAKCF